MIKVSDKQILTLQHVSNLSTSSFFFIIVGQTVRSNITPVAKSPGGTGAGTGFETVVTGTVDISVVLGGLGLVGKGSVGFGGIPLKVLCWHTEGFLK